MTEPTLADLIKPIVTENANNNPAPVQCTITKNYNDEPTKIDVTTPIGEFRYITCLNSNTVGRKGILIFLNGNYDNPIAIIETRSI